MSETLHSAAATVASWRSAEERGDVDAAVACLSRDVVLSEFPDRVVEPVRHCVAAGARVLDCALRRNRLDTP
ncbi:hypothetical protein FE633_26805 [Streptomyces montanus]|uniref:Uncharacterized protein n=1 Tax=Streptomyces montanus TaxID=2580423 RepID=A0A5R9FKS2_9ACTN|nr:hypothetical protein [Streptomyces montanus]TLS43159.1 hypothetical protein FE633_26805 [Streptomyces montanus]